MFLHLLTTDRTNVRDMNDKEESFPVSDLVVARGTEEGLILRIDGRNNSAQLESSIRAYLSARKEFISASPLGKYHDVVIEWIAEIPTEEVIEVLKKTVFNEFSLVIKASRLYERKTKKINVDESKYSKDVMLDVNKQASGLGLFSGIGSIGAVAGQSLDTSYTAEKSIKMIHPVKSEEKKIFRHSQTNSEIQKVSVPWDVPNAKVFFQTLRSGQRLESEHSIILIGDVNQGAEIISENDILVLGSLRGLAHAGAFKESSAGCIVFALCLAPMQIRIGSLITRGAEDSNQKLDDQTHAEFARVDAGIIVVERYYSKQVPVQIKRAVN
jgi:septum site-determining protein MinC